MPPAKKSGRALLREEGKLFYILMGIGNEADHELGRPRKN